MVKLAKVITLFICTMAMGAGCGGHNPPNPIPTPTPTPPPISMALKVSANRLVLLNGTDPRILGSIIGCHIEGPSGWPLICTQSLDAIAAAGLNWTHVRTGPFTAEAESPEFAFYEKGVGGKYDLTKINQAFLELVRQKAVYAKGLKVYLEVDLPVDRWPLQHRVSPWQAGNNVQGEEHGGLGIFNEAPDAVHEAAIRAVVAATCDLDNVMYQAGNEAFKADSAKFTRRVVELVRECPNPHVVGINSGLSLLGDFTVLHQSSAPTGIGIEVNEYGDDISPDQVINETVKADRGGAYFHYWRGSHSSAEWLSTLQKLGEIRAGHPPTPTPDCQIPTTDVPQVLPRPAGGGGRNELTAAVQANVKAAYPELFDASGNLSGWPSDGAAQSAYAQRYFNPLVAHLRGLGYCASAWEDSIAWGKPEWGFYEEWHVLAFGHGTPIIGAQAYRYTWKFEGGTTPPSPPVGLNCPMQLPIPTGYSLGLRLDKRAGTQQVDGTPYVKDQGGIFPPPGWTGSCRPHQCDLSAEKDPEHGTACTLQLCGAQLEYELSPPDSGLINWVDGYTAKVTMTIPGLLIGRCELHSGATGSVSVP